MLTTLCVVCSRGRADPDPLIDALLPGLCLDTSLGTKYEHCSRDLTGIAMYAILPRISSDCRVQPERGERDSPIAGTAKLHRSEEKLAAADIELTSDGLREIDKVASKITRARRSLPRTIGANDRALVSEVTSAPCKTTRACPVRGTKVQLATEDDGADTASSRRSQGSRNSSRPQFISGIALVSAGFRNGGGIGCQESKSG